MINFCLMVILLSALRKILWQIDETFIITIDDNLESIFYATMGFIMFLYDIVKPTKTEIALYEKQKELAIENIFLILNKAKSVFNSIYNKLGCKSYKKNLKLLPVSQTKTEFNEEFSKVA
ncbi:MAG: hypothetical protein UHK60_02815 [Acutalibacteraceae bacterium]|nr:hypothetical protein [Acutalibacteraceae bacterium]